MSPDKETCRVCGKVYNYQEEGNSKEPDLCDDCYEEVTLEVRESID